VGEEDTVLLPDPLGGLAQRGGSGHRLGELLLEDLGVEELLRVLPLVERLGLVEPLVALEPDQLAARRGRHDLGELRLAHPRGSLDQDGLLELVGQVDHRRDLLVGDVLLLGEGLQDLVYGIEHA
jgi:hypothetical protein